MRHMTLLATAAALVLATPAFAQDAAPAAPATPQAAPAPQAPPTPEQQAIQAQGEAFGQRIQAMATEIQAAATAAGSDTAKARADADVIVARYQPDADAFAATVSDFIATQGGAESDQTQATTEITAVPGQVRDQVLAATASAPAAPAAAPATPQ